MSDVERIREGLNELRRIVESDPENILRRAATVARASDDETIRLLAPVFEQWALVARFGDQILRVGGPETIAVARKLLGEADR